MSNEGVFPERQIKSSCLFPRHIALSAPLGDYGCVFRLKKEKNCTIFSTCYKRLKLQMYSYMWPEKPKHSTFNVDRLITRQRPHYSLRSSSCPNPPRPPHATPPPHSYLPVDLRVLLPWLPMSNGSSPFENHHSSPFTHMQAYAGVHMLSVWGNGSHPSRRRLFIVCMLLSVPS